MGTSKIGDMIAKAKKVTPKPKKGFHVRPGAVATCREVLVCSEPCAVLFHGLLEMWVEIPAKIVRQYKGENRQFLYLSGDNLATLTGRDKKTLQNTVIRELRAKQEFILVEQAKLTPEHSKGYRISINTTPFCEAVIQELQPFKEIAQGVEGGGTMIKKRMDKAKLPYVFKRLYDEYVRANGEFSP